MLRIPRSLESVAVATALLIIASVSCAAESNAHWSYTGPTRPAKWGALEKDYASCALGQIQSPIDIRDDVAVKADIPAINFDYKPSALKIIDNGHTIQINYQPESFITN